MATKIYDKAKYHYDAEDFSADLPMEAGATHIAYPLRWCIENDLMSRDFLGDFEDEAEYVKQGKLDCREFLIGEMDGVFTSDDLNTKGKKFMNAYYIGEKTTKFAKEVGEYLYDFTDFTEELESCYHSEYSEENYQKIKSIIDSRYRTFLDKYVKK